MNAEIRSQFRRFYRISMRAVQYSSPAKYCMLAKVKRCFRHMTPHPDALVEARIRDNTYDFLERAAREKGLEHKIVRNLCFVEWSRYAQQKTSLRRVRSSTEGKIKQSAYQSYEKTILNLNDSCQIRLT